MREETPMTQDEMAAEVQPGATPEPISRGVRAFIGVAMAIAGVVAAANPNSAVLRALNQAMPQLADAVPTLITACGAVVAAFSPPPKLRRRRMRRGQKRRAARVFTSGSGSPP
jgi:hypothetical protein